MPLRNLAVLLTFVAIEILKKLLPVDVVAPAPLASLDRYSKREPVLLQPQAQELGVHAEHFGGLNDGHTLCPVVRKHGIASSLGENKKSQHE